MYKFLPITTPVLQLAKSYNLCHGPFLPHSSYIVFLLTSQGGEADAHVPPLKSATVSQDVALSIELVSDINTISIVRNFWEFFFS